MESSNCMEDHYPGSRAFTWLADLCGLSVDMINFLICQTLALLLASLFRSYLHSSKVSSAVRHTFALTVGLAFGYFCFGKQAIHIAGLPTVCYIVIRTQSPRVVQRNVMIVAMIYLLCIHLMRQIYDYGSYALDITGPLMIITQKVTSLAFSIHDGFVRQDQELTKAQQYHAVKKLPSALEYFSYVLHFQGIMAGPLVFYRDYIDFVEGCNLRPSTNAFMTFEYHLQGNLDNGITEVVLEPSPMKAVIKKVIGSIMCAFIFMKFIKIYPMETLKDDDFLQNASIVYKFWYVMMATTCVRFKYYHAWLLADAICNNSGLGFTGYDKEGNSKWDLISNINVLPFEFATNMRDAINNWNCGTNRWLRTIVYERVPKKHGTVLTFALSAVWHGFYPGYYLTFATGALLVTSARSARRMFRHRFQSTQFTRMFYDILTCLTTRVVMGYGTFPFIMLEFMPSIRLYLKFYLCLHIASLITIFILPRFIHGERRPKSPNESHEQLNDATRNTGGGILKANGSVSRVLNGASTSAAAAAARITNIPQNNGYDLDDVELSSPHLSPTSSTSLFDKIQLPDAAFARDAVSVQHDQCEMDQLSSKLREKFDAETKNIEDFIDKTVTETVSGIVELKRDLMRDCEFPTLIAHDSLRKRGNAGVGSEGAALDMVKKEIEVINAVVQQANVLPVMLSNGHAK